jgi:hypothetical protein
VAAAVIPPIPAPTMAMESFFPLTKFSSAVRNNT